MSRLGTAGTYDDTPDGIWHVCSPAWARPQLDDDGVTLTANEAWRVEKYLARAACSSSTPVSLAARAEDRNRLVLEQQLDAVAAGLDDVGIRRHAPEFVQLMIFSPVQPTEDIDAEPLVGVSVADAHAISQVAGRVVQAFDAHRYA